MEEWKVRGKEECSSESKEQADTENVENTKLPCRETVTASEKRQFSTAFVLLGSSGDCPRFVEKVCRLLASRVEL